MFGVLPCNFHALVGGKMAEGVILIIFFASLTASIKRKHSSFAQLTSFSFCFLKAYDIPT